jgi:hypothetical protein
MANPPARAVAIRAASKVHMVPTVLFAARAAPQVAGLASSPCDAAVCIPGRSGSSIAARLPAWNGLQSERTHGMLAAPVSVDDVHRAIVEAHERDLSSVR